MDIISLAILTITIMLSEEILNGELKVSQKLLQWIDRNNKTPKKISPKN